jgi:autotransporter-associated beta strand protein
MVKLPLARSIKVFCLATALGGFYSHAEADLTWDGNPSTAGLQDGGGSWLTTGTDRWFNGTAYQSYGIGTNSVIFGNNSGAAGAVTVDGAINVANMTFNAAGTGSYQIAAGSGSLTLNNSTIIANDNATITATLAGSTGLIKTGNGILSLAPTGNANTFTGEIDVNQGALLITSKAVADDSTHLVIVATGAQLQIADGASLSRGFSASGTGLNNSGALLFTGASGTVGGVVVSGNTSIGASGGTVSTANSIGVIGGTGNVTKVGPGTIRLGGGQASSYSGLMTVAAGTLLAQTSMFGGLSITSGLTINSGATFGAQSGGVFSPSSDVIVNGTMDLSANPAPILPFTVNFTTAINSLTGSGSIISTYATAGSTLLISSTSTSSTFSGAISGATSLQKSGAGTSLTLSASSNTYTGSTRLDDGTFNLGGSLPNSSLIDIRGGTFKVTGSATIAAPVTVIGSGNLAVTGSLTGATSVTFGDASTSGGILSGTGTLATSGGGSVLLQHAGAHLAPGDAGVGILSVVLGAGTLDLTGLVGTVDSFRFELGSVAASDRVVLTSGTLKLTSIDIGAFNFTPLAGFGPGTYTLFDTSNLIVGDFAGANLSGTVGGYSASLAFINGGQDLVLMVVPEPSSALLAVTGGLLALGRRRRK